jgi:hypothetical protein
MEMMRTIAPICRLLPVLMAPTLFPQVPASPPQYSLIRTTVSPLLRTTASPPLRTTASPPLRTTAAPPLRTTASQSSCSSLFFLDRGPTLLHNSFISEQLLLYSSLPSEFVHQCSLISILKALAVLSAQNSCSMLCHL